MPLNLVFPRRPVFPVESRRTFPGDCPREQPPVRWARRDECPMQSAVHPLWHCPPPRSGEGLPAGRQRPALVRRRAPLVNVVPLASAAELAPPHRWARYLMGRRVPSLIALLPIALLREAAQSLPISSPLAPYDSAQMPRPARVPPAGTRARPCSCGSTELASHPAEPPERSLRWQ